jgi:NAD(P)-dependent dehydrogenase (short-subunit alcohol dehydrogenase family)
MTVPGFHGQVAVVTGGSRGVGAAACRLLAAGGARVAAVSADGVALQEIVDELHWQGAEAIGVVADCADPAAAAEVRDRVVAELGEPSIVICADHNVDVIAKAFADCLKTDNAELAAFAAIYLASGAVTSLQVTTLAGAGESSYP